MAVQLVPKRLLRVTPVLMAALAVVGPRPAAAQQAADVVVPVTTKAVAAPSPTATLAPAEALLGPRLPQPVASVARPTLGNDAMSSSFAMTPDSGGRHTIVISTLSLVLIVVLIVLLI